MQAGIIGALAQIPAVNSPRACLDGIGPIARAVISRRSALRRGVQSKQTADAVILTMEKAEDIGEGSFAPAQGDFRRLQASGGPRQVPVNANAPRRLQENTAAPGLCLELEFPAARRDLFDAAGNSYEGERKFLLLILEIDTPFVEFDSLKVMHRRNRGGRPVNARSLRRSVLRRRKPALKVPSPFKVAHQNEAWPAERQGAKFKMAAEQARPSQAGAQMLGAKEILVAECGVFAHGHSVGVELRTWKNASIETAHLNGPSEGPFEMCGEVGMHAVRPHQEGDGHLQGTNRQHGGQADLPPFSQLAHALRKFKEL